MLDLWTDLLGCLDLHRASDSPDIDGVVTFDGVSQQLDYHRVFGGQLLGQFIRAAALACPEKTVKSLHAVFAREGRAAEPVRYRSTRQHEGRSFASLTITADQPHAVLASAAVSMHASEDGPENQDCEPISTLLGAAHRVELDLIPWETRCAQDLGAAATGPPKLEVWMRTPPVDIPRMAELSMAMVRTALRALTERDAELAVTVLAMDDAVDEMNRRAKSVLLECISKDSSAAKSAINLLFISRSLERIADHATNMAEDVIFWVRGADVRHGHTLPVQ